MNRRLTLLLTAAVLLLPAVALAASSRQVWVNNCVKEQYKPKSITLACADGNTLLEKLKWSRWGTRSASGSGEFAYNECTPSCSAGKFRGFAVTVRLSRPKSCPQHKHKAFNRVTATFTGRPPKGYPKTQRFTLGCPD